ncbi:CAF1-domain-containing protein [Hortaea werneckii]|nr:CAF1-domain-containing protein [Hortaea werneckii]KAI7325530.1 CAF1-domain-containing protein [Hortaea werneckii]
MNVDKVSFYPFILDILTDISESRFVAIDLELSGVPTKQIRHQAGKPSLQDRYAETKEAAERYQILQIGVTCVKQDVENDKYVLRPYNFDLSPIIEERGLDVERIFSFQSGACEFLLKAGFDMARPYTHGVPYLSRDESREARQKHAKRQDKSAMADIQIKPTEVESLAFLERVRTQINDWLAKRAKNSAGDSVEIMAAGAENVAEDQPVPELSRFERRLVHQLVRAEYPDFVTVSRHTYIQIVPFDKAREERIAAQRRRELEERINRQKGFRWIVEALLGSDLSKLDLREVAKSPVTGDAVFADMDEYRAQFNRACGLLRDNPRVLVGHNCFLDLVYVYRTFIGELPPTVVEFQQKLHALWPTIVDTKYMSTHNCGDINPVSSLEQIATQLSDQAEPKLELDEHHRAYEKEERFHEAGYDSFLTAQIAVRLSSKLEKAGAYIDADSQKTSGITNGMNGMNLTNDDDSALRKPAIDAKSDGNTLNPTADGFTPSVVGAKWKRVGDPTVAGTQGVNDPFQYNPHDLRHYHEDPTLEQGFAGGMPLRGSDFWRVYGNKLRVFGTEEGVCVLDSGDAQEMGSSDEDGDGMLGEGQGGVEIECP